MAGFQNFYPVSVFPKSGNRLRSSSDGTNNELKELLVICVLEGGLEVGVPLIG